jgi:hypothetical protein
MRLRVVRTCTAGTALRRLQGGVDLGAVHGRRNYTDIRQRRFNMARAAPDLLAEVDRFSFGRNCNRRVT